MHQARATQLQVQVPIHTGADDVLKEAGHVVRLDATDFRNRFRRLPPVLLCDALRLARLDLLDGRQHGAQDALGAARLASEAPS